MNTTTQNTTATIESLRAEAAEHGDLEMSDICDRALAGDDAALRECERALSDAAAQRD